MQGLGLLEVLHADFEAVGVGEAGPLDTRGLLLLCLLLGQGRKLVLLHQHTISTHTL